MDGAPSESTPAAARRATRRRSSLPPTKVAAFGAITLVLLLILLEAVSFLGARLLAQKSVFYLPVPSEGYAEYLRYRDPVLGWPRPDSYGPGVPPDTR